MAHIISEGTAPVPAECTWIEMSAGEFKDKFGASIEREYGNCLVINVYNDGEESHIADKNGMKLLSLYIASQIDSSNFPFF